MSNSIQDDEDCTGVWVSEIDDEEDFRKRFRPKRVKPDKRRYYQRRLSKVG